MDFLKKNIYVIAAAICIVAIGALYAVQLHKPRELSASESAGVVLYDAERESTDEENSSEAASDKANQNEPNPDGISSEENNSNETPDEIVVYISGEVTSPGVYELPSDARVNDVLTMAGGFTEKANKSGINLAAKVSDEEHITVPAIGEVITADSSSGGTSNNATSGGGTGNASSGITNGLININTADSLALQQLPNIGEVIAGYIIDYREANGGFKSVDEILNVERIGSATYGKIKDKITVG